MNKVKTITGVFIVAAFLVIVGYDVWAVLAGGIEATISEVVWEYATSYPIIPFATGVLCGHLFWQTRITK